MSILIDSLERILSWLHQNKPSFASSLQPGFSEAEIREMLEEYEFPLLLSYEFYELYQWRNGVPYGDEEVISFLPGYAFNSLEYALDQYADLRDSSDFWKAELLDLLPIFTRDDEEHLYVRGSKEQLDYTPVLHYYAEFGEPTVSYQNLTRMMQVTAECYETGIYYISEYGDFEIDEDGAREVYQRYDEA